MTANPISSSGSISRLSDLISGQPLAGAEEIVDLGPLPIPGLFFPTAALAEGAQSVVRMVRAPASGLLQLDRDVDPALYLYYKSGRADQAHLAHVERTAEDIARSCPTDARILEIGGGAGHLMNALARRGFRHLHIVDPSAENKAGQGYQAIRGMFPGALADSEQRFDVIVGQHFLEHSAEPVAVLRAAGELLTARGQIWIEVPDIERSALSEQGEWLSIIYALHSAYYDRATLESAGVAAGLAMVRAYTVDHYGKSLVAVFTKAAAPAPGWASRAVLDVGADPVAAAIRSYFRQLAEFGRTLPPGLLCWGAAERCLTVLGACMAGGFQPGALCDSNPDLWGLYPSGMKQPVLAPPADASPIEEVLVLSVRHAGAIVAANRDRFAPEATIHIPFAEKRTIAQFLSPQ